MRRKEPVNQFEGSIHDPFADASVHNPFGGGGGAADPFALNPSAFVPQANESVFTLGETGESFITGQSSGGGQPRKKKHHHHHMTTPPQDEGVGLF